MSTSSPGAEPAEPGHRSAAGLPRPRQRAPHVRAVHAHGRACAPSVRRRSRFHRFPAAHIKDAINKGMQAQKNHEEAGDAHWAVPYLPIDPHDIDRSYESIIRIIPQAAKAAWPCVLKQNLAFNYKAMHPEFARVVQAKLSASVTNSPPCTFSSSLSRNISTRISSPTACSACKSPSMPVTASTMRPPSPSNSASTATTSSWQAAVSARGSLRQRPQCQHAGQHHPRSLQ